MGMSAAQARLLSITTRLNNNEFRSQTITNSKLRLADKSSEASQEYMNALNSQKLVYSYFDDNGESNQINMTAGMVYTYSPLKNQYALMNSAGKMLVSSKDAENFEQSNNLIEFLEKYGLVKNSSAYEQYNKDKAIYDAKKDQYDNKDYPAYLELQGQWEKYDKEKAEYDEAMKQPDLYAEYSSIVGTSDTVQNTGAQGHYYRALNEGNTSCFLHVLNVLLDYNGTNLSTSTYDTSVDGVTVTLEGKDGGMRSDLSADENTKMVSISAALENHYCDGIDVGTGENLLKTARENGTEPSIIDRLKSDYIEIEKGDGTYSYEKKNLKQKAIDMYYLIKNYETSQDEKKAILTNFTEGDMKRLTPEPPTPPEEPLVKPEVPIAPIAPLYETILNDKDKGQWYVNLWHMMNGSDTANIVNTYDNIYVDENDSKNNVTETIFVVENADRNPLTKNYDIFDDNLINNSEWLQFALEHGIITLAKAEFFDPSSDSGKTPELTSRAITWKSTIFTNASDFKYVDDETAVAIAEVKYKNAMREIENQDKKYDQDLKKLDTEHSAMTTEYESIKEAMNKNVERSFKAFS